MFIFSWKNYLCFSKFKCFPIINLPPPPSPSSKQTQNSSSTTIINNFNSLYDLTSPASTSTSSDDHSSSDYTDGFLPDLATVFASQRFFFSSPGHSNSIVHSPNSPTNPDNALVTGGIAVQTFSPDPFQDFRNSMQEMVEARELTDVEADWDFLHELLFCYLTLNPKHTHKFIIKAFSDLIISLMSSESCRKIEDRHHSTTSQHLV